MDVQARVSAELAAQVVRWRRDFHAYPEQGWLEIRTSAVIAAELRALGYEVLMGAAVCGEERLGLPTTAAMDQAAAQALAEGVDAETVAVLRDGHTGVIGILRCGEGPTVALRFDIDALPLTERDDADHRPAREGFASKHPGTMHACGHDGHTAIGLGVATLLARERARLHGTVKLIFQPAEEGVRGAASIVQQGHLDDVDILLAAHVQARGAADGDVIAGACGAMATTKLDAVFHGQAAHAASAPETGRNVMLGLATAISNLYAIPRHSGGASRVNVGIVSAGSGRNVIADTARLALEVRGETTAINDYMEAYARRILESAAAMHDLRCRLTVCGQAASMASDPALMERVQAICAQLADVVPSHTLCQPLHDSEDIATMMAQVQARGGQATFMRLLTTFSDAPHCHGFDFDEGCLRVGIEVFVSVVCALLAPADK